MEVSKINNGLTIITDKDNSANTATIGYVIACGSHDEAEDEMGIAHFTEHMLFKGTTNRNAQEISKDIEAIGGILNAETSYEHTKYHCTVPSSEWEIACDVLSDMIWNNLIPKDEFNSEKQVILEELKMYYDKPRSRAMQLLSINMHFNYKNRQYIGGTIETVKKINREQMINFIDKFYVPSNMVVIATGDIEHDKLVNFFKNYCLDIEIKDELNDYKKSEFNPPKLNGDQLVEEKNTMQSHLCWGLFGAQPNTQECVIGDVIVTLLGGNTCSRLYQIIREQKGLAYTITMDNEEFSDISIIKGYVGLNKENINDVKNIIKKEMFKLKDELVTDEELERAKSYIEGNLKIGLETPSAQNGFLTQAIIINSDIDIDNYFNKIKSVTKEDIMDFARKYFNKDNITFSQVISKD
jgi:predicted Zn-dependent peptidase